MRRFLSLLAACCAALLLHGCTPRDVVVTKDAGISLKILQATGSKVTFSVSTTNENATYLIFVMPESHLDFDLSDREAAQEYIRYLEDMRSQITSESQDGFRDPEGRFEDYAFYRGSRELKIKYLSDDTDYRLILFQVHPKTHELIGKGCSEQFHTRAINKVPLNFSFSIEKNILTITPSDPSRTYFWSIEREARIYDDYDNIFFYLYSLIDMYETYGFVEPQLSKGTVSETLDPDLFREGETYWLSAIGYGDGEINSEESSWSFVCYKGILTGGRD